MGVVSHFVGVVLAIPTKFRILWVWFEWQLLAFVEGHAHKAKREVPKLIFFHRAEVREFSPQKNLDLIKKKLPSRFPCLLAVGGDESDEFKRQGEEFHKVRPIKEINNNHSPSLFLGIAHGGRGQHKLHLPREGPFQPYGGFNRR